jgi:hypothetical protein
MAAAAAVFVLLARVHAESFELRGYGFLPDVGIAPFGVPGEEITVSVMLSSDDFQYVPVDDAIIHYFSPSTAIPVDIVGAVSGEYPDVSPIARFVALELEGSVNGGDRLGLDVAAGAAGTSLLSLSTSGASGFDGSVTPHSPEDLFSLFAGAMNNEGLWTASTSSAVFVGSGSDLLYLGELQWTLIVPIAGDGDADGDVDGRDFLLWQRDPNVGLLEDWQANYGAVASDPQTLDLLGDFNLDGDVDGRDFLLWQRDPSIGSLADWQANYGESTALSEVLAVPEPAAITIAVTGGLAYILRRQSVDRRAGV